MVKNLPANAGEVSSIPHFRKGQEDLLEEEMAIHSSILAWEILWTEEPAGLQPVGLERAGHDSTQVHRCKA